MTGNDGENYDEESDDRSEGWEECLKKKYPELYADASFQEMRNQLTVLYNMVPEEEFTEVLEKVADIIREHLKKAGIEDKEYE